MTEPNAHAKVVVPVLEAGYNCFGEKPMDITVEAIDAVTAAARKAKGFYQIGTQRRSHPTYQAMMKFIQDGLMGAPSFLQGGWHWSAIRRANAGNATGATDRAGSHHTL